MKILQVNNVYDFGSTGRITRDIHQGLLEYGYDSVVYYGRRFRTKDENVHKICSELYGKAQNGLYQITGIKYGGCYLSTNRLIKAIKNEKPDVVHLQCLNGHFVNIYRLINYLKINKIPTVLTLHAEFMYTGGCSHAVTCNQWRESSGCGTSACPLYKKELKSKMGDKSSVMWKLMREAFDGFDKLVVVSVSPWLMKRAKESYILRDKNHTVVYNGIDNEIFHEYSTEELNKLKSDLGFKMSDVIIFQANPVFDNNPNNIKGGYYFLQLADRMKNYQFLVAGRYDPTLCVSANVKLLGSINDKELIAKLYAMSDVTVITSKRETFSMVCAESLCCGTPVVGYKAGAPELISLPEYSSFCEFGDIDELERLVSIWVEKGKSSNMFENSKEVYKNQKMVDDYIKIYTKLLLEDRNNRS